MSRVAAAVWGLALGLVACGIGTSPTWAQEEDAGHADSAFAHAAEAARLREVAPDDPRTARASARVVSCGAPALAHALGRARAAGAAAVGHELCRALGDLAEPGREAPGALVEALADLNSLVRHAAAVALVGWVAEARWSAAIGLALGDAVDAAAFRPSVALAIVDPSDRNALAHALARAGYAPRSATGGPGLSDAEEVPLAVLVRDAAAAGAWAKALGEQPRAASTAVFAIEEVDGALLARLAGLADHRAALAGRTARPAVGALARAHESVLPLATGALIRAVRTAHPDRGACARALGRVLDPAAGAALVVLLEDAGAALPARLAAASAMGTRFDRGAPADPVEVAALAHAARGLNLSALAEAALAALGRAPLTGTRRLELVDPAGSAR